MLQQPPDDREDYAEAGAVPVEQKWTVKDLKEMANPAGNLYSVAVRELRLKDRVVRHLREDLQQYKKTYRASRLLLEMGGGGRGD